MKREENYTANSIDMLDEIESVRLKFGMYIGDAGPNGLHHLIWEIISNSADEALNGNGNEITVTLHPDNYIEVSDNGSGIPVGYNEKHKMDALDLIMLFKHSGGKLRPGDTTYTKGSIGTNGLGMFIVNCLSERMIITSRRNKKVYQAEYGLGKQLVPVHEIGTLNTNSTGTSVKWLSDKKIFTQGLEYDKERIESKLKMMSYMLPKVKLIFRDLRDPKKKIEESYYSENGLIDLLTDKLRGKSTLLKNSIHIKETVNHQATKYDDAGVQYIANQAISVEICMNFDASHRDDTILTYVNGNDIPLGGTMVTGFRRGFIRAVNNYARETKVLKDKDSDFKFNEIKDGIFLCIEITHPDPSFDGQTKVKINNQELDGICSTIVSSKLERYAIDNSREMDKLVDYFMRLRKGKAKYDSVLDSELKKITTPSSKSINLAELVNDATSKDREKCELYIVEGDSAAGSTMTSRDSSIHAIFKLKGKIINTYKESLSRSLANKEVQSLLKVIGSGSIQSDQFDLKKSRYGKIIIMADADVN